MDIHVILICVGVLLAASAGLMVLAAWEDFK